MKSKRTISTLQSVALAGFICCSAAPWSVHAAAFTVDSNTDVVDANPGDGICDDGAGNCTLRAAIMEANALAGADSISLGVDTYTLSITGVDERCDGTTPCTGNGTENNPYLPVVTADASIGDLDITSDLTITGAGPDQTVVGWGSAPSMDTDPLTGDRVFHIQTDGANIDSVLIEELTVLNGEVGLLPTDAGTVGTPNAYDIDIVDDTAGSVTIWQFRRMGGAIGLGASNAVVLYEESIHGPGGGGGGGDSDMGPFPGGKPGDEEGFSIGDVTLNHVVLMSSWSGADGGGLYSAAPATVVDSVISGNESGANGGGIYNDEVLELENTTLGALSDTPPAGFPATGLDSGNDAENGGALFDTGFHTTTIRQTSINGNTAIGGGGIAGRAGIVIDLTNCTVSGNIASDVGGGITTNGTINLTNVTVANNTADTDAPGGGGGLNSFGSGVYNMVNTIVAGNTKNSAAPVASNCGCSGGSPTCPPGTMVSLGNNLEDDNTCLLAFTGDQTNTDPLLVALADNNTLLDGLTETHAIPDTSPALDSGNNTVCPNNDQRGSIRPADGGSGFICDIGAFELFRVFTDLHINNMTAPNRVDQGDTVPISIEVHNTGGAPDTNIVVTATLPAALSYISATITGGACVEANGLVTCNLANLGDDAIATVDISTTAVSIGNTVVTAAALSDNDTDPSNNFASVNIEVLGSVDMELTAIASTNSVTLGQQVTVTFTVSNLGPDDATGVRMGGTLPAGATYVSATPDNGTACSENNGDILCALGAIGVGGPDVDVVLVVTADAVGTVDLSASVDADQSDPDGTNNTVSATVTVNTAPTSSGGGGGGGGCTLNRHASFQPLFPMLVLGGLFYIGLRNLRRR